MKKETGNEVKRRTRHARTPEQRENQLINLAVDLAERQLREGSATSQVIVHFLRLATMKEKLENDKLRADLKLAEAKVKQIETAESKNILYEKVIDALKSYGAFSRDEEEEGYDE